MELSERIDRAFIEVERRHFMPESLRHLADADRPFAIGFDQTISQPYTVKNMLLWLGPQPGDRILDVGSGSGWTSALLSYLAGRCGHVYAVERIPELKQFGEKNCRHFGCCNLEFFIASGHLGLPDHAPFDRILVSAAASQQIPTELLAQLAPCGKMVIPVDHIIYEIHKSDNEEIDYCLEHPGYVFVPLVE